MKLTCECGHPNHLHFAGTQHCHAEHPDVLIHFPGRFKRCECARFVPVSEATRKDIHK